MHIIYAHILLYYNLYYICIYSEAGGVQRQIFFVIFL